MEHYVTWFTYTTTYDRASWYTWINKMGEFLGCKDRIEVRVWVENDRKNLSILQNVYTCLITEYGKLSCKITFPSEFLGVEIFQTVKGRILFVVGNYCLKNFFDSHIFFRCVRNAVLRDYDLSCVIFVYDDIYVNAECYPAVVKEKQTTYVSIVNLQRQTINQK